MPSGAAADWAAAKGVGRAEGAKREVAATEGAKGAKGEAAAATAAAVAATAAAVAVAAVRAVARVGAREAVRGADDRT